MKYLNITFVSSKSLPPPSPLLPTELQMVNIVTTIFNHFSLKFERNISPKLTILTSFLFTLEQNP